MKNKIFIVVFFALNSFLNTSCEKNPLNQALEKCNLNGDLIFIENRTGELVFTDTIPGLRFSQKDYFIINHNVDSIYLSLKPCNIPEQYKKTLLNTNLLMKFDGNFQILQNTVDAASLNFEFSKIELINN